MAKALRASLLVLLLAGSAQAGWMQNGSPVPPPQTNEVEQTAEGDTLDEAEGSLAGFALNLLLGVLTLP